MTLKIYQYVGDVHVLNKEPYLGNEHTITGSLTDPTNAVSPEIMLDSFKDVELSFFDPSVFNYAFIDEFHRFYYITNWEAVDEYHWIIRMQSDPLTSFHDYIEDLDCYCLRTSNSYKQTIDVVDTEAPMKAYNWVRNFTLNAFSAPTTMTLVTAG